MNGAVGRSIMRRMNLMKTRHLAPFIAAAGMIAVGAVLPIALAV
jgi:hypothetical protein